ncbi:hypothetical protein [Pedobacter jejuensis]|nr:hypothetical protein [Pedobacter jejuensis]
MRIDFQEKLADVKGNAEENKKQALKDSIHFLRQQLIKRFYKQAGFYN